MDIRSWLHFSLATEYQDVIQKYKNDYQKLRANKEEIIKEIDKVIVSLKEHISFLFEQLNEHLEKERKDVEIQYDKILNIFEEQKTYPKAPWC